MVDTTVFGEEVHVVYVNDTEAGVTTMPASYINVVQRGIGTLAKNFELSTVKLEIHGCPFEFGNQFQWPKAANMSSWATYNYALSADEVAVLSR